MSIATEVSTDHLWKHLEAICQWERYTGTPGEPGEMKDGDVCEIEIDGIGVLSNPIKLEK